LTLARPHLAQAVRLEANPEALRLLAAIDLQQGRGVDAMQSLTQIIAQSANEPLSLAESQLLRHDLLRDLRNVSPRNPNPSTDASGALAAALQSVLKARSQASSANGQAGVERVLSRVLEDYGDNAAARRASERAMDAATTDPSQLVSVILDAVRRALTAGDLQSARIATRRALDEDLADRDIAYAGLWLTLLEQQLKATPDGTAREVLSRTSRGDDWPAKLSNWALGKLSDAALQASAKSKIQGVEATFYLAMAARAHGDKQAAIAGLRRVAAGEAVELFEVTIARDLLSQYDGWTKPALPANIEIP